MPSEVVDLFLELAALPSPPGKERAVADAVTRYLRDLGLDVDEDGAGAAVGSDMGNLYCRLDPNGNGGTPIFLCAHLDTVPPEGPLEPVIEDGVLRLGRVDEETTANVGLINGGSAANIVPEWCTLSAEARSHDERKLGDLVQEMVDAFAFAAGLEDCEVETRVSKSYRGYRFKRDDTVVRIAHAALERAGYTPSYGLSGGAADANIFNERGLACLNLANGMQNIHTADERITVDDLEGMVEVTLALVDVARDNGADA